MVKKFSMASVFLCTLVFVFALPISVSSSSSVSFSLFNRDAQSSPLRIQEAYLSELLEEEMPMREFVSAGMAMRGRIRRQRRARGAAGPIVGSFSYLKENVGDFYLTVSVGSPPQNLILTLDTGSELTWTQCKPCKVCSTANGPTFAFNKSSSFLTVPCASPLCVQSLGFSGGCSNSTGFCTFQLQYGDGSTDAGYISIDSFHFNRGFSKPLVFGCAVINMDTVPVPTSGIMGLNAGPFSFTSQLLGNTPKLADKFAYCLPNRFRNLNSRGTIQFGNYELPMKLNYTPLVPPYGPLGDLYYFVKLEGISVGERFIRAEMGDQGLAGGGTIFDSGTAITHLERSLYVEMIVEMRKQTAGLNPFETKGPAGDVCYRVSRNSTALPEVPMVVMHFAGKVRLELGPESVLYPSDVDEQGIIVCVAFIGSQSSIPFNIIGNYQQQNHWVEFNLDSSRIGLVKTSCVGERR